MTPAQHTQFVLISNQAAPNLLPLLDPHFKPKRLVLLVSPQMHTQANWFISAIKPLGIPVQKVDFDPALSLYELREILLKFVIELKEGSYSLNVTGGNKWMAIAAQDIFNGLEAPVFYVDIQSNQVRFLGEEGREHTLQNTIGLRTYLQAYGCEIVSEQKTGLPPQLREFCERLVGQVTQWEGAIGYLNKLASDAEKQPTKALHFDAPPNHFNALLKEAERANLVRVKGNQLRFADETSRQFCNGGWLEAYVARLLGGLRGKGLLQDPPHLNVTLQRNHSKNELDVVFMAKNRLHVIECKTKRMEGGHAGQVGAEAVYKLDVIRDLGGLGTQAMLVSYRKLLPADKQRAKDLNIRVVACEQLGNLKNQLEQWLTP